MAEVIIMPYGGFCPGVRRAIRLAKRELFRRPGPVYSLGPLIHNTQVVKWLAAKGLQPVDDIAAIHSGCVIVRAHGTTPQVMEELARRGVTVVDGTCPAVKRVQERARELADQGYQVVIVGERSHPEVQGVVGWAGPRTLVVENAGEAKSLLPMSKAGVVAQTTLPPEVFRQVTQVLRKKAGELVVEETICSTTRLRQEAARKLAQEVDLVVVVGSGSSANTMRLVEICRAVGTPTYRVEDVHDLDPQWFAKASRVGVAAGASTPDWVIRRIAGKLEKLTDGGTPMG